VLTDGKAGDEQPCLAVAEALGLLAETRRVQPRKLFAWLMPWGPIDPAEAPGRQGSPIAPPYPDLLIASGRRSVPYLRAVKRLSGGRTFTVFLKDPRTGSRTADALWVPAHDRLRGDNVLATLTPPHRVSVSRLAAARAHPDPRLAMVTAPRVAVLVGGDSRHHRFTPPDIARFASDLAELARSGAGLMISMSRRTPVDLREALVGLAAERGAFLWDGSGDNPYVGMLALAEAVVVTADSFNMAGEAAASGVPILVFEPSGGHPKLSAFNAALAERGIVHVFRGRLEGQAYEPLDTTPTLARFITERLARHRQSLGLGMPAPRAEIR
jgi:mitochondrial fission protein ELM1